MHKIQHCKTQLAIWNLPAQIAKTKSQVIWLKGQIDAVLTAHMWWCLGGDILQKKKTSNKDYCWSTNTCSYMARTNFDPLDSSIQQYTTI